MLKGKKRNSYEKIISTERAEEGRVGGKNEGNKKVDDENFQRKSLVYFYIWEVFELRKRQIQDKNSYPSTISFFL